MFMPMSTLECKVRSAPARVVLPLLKHMIAEFALNV